jgi:hypothetical protein
MTPCSAKVLTSAICRSVYGSILRRPGEAYDPNRRSIAQQWHTQHRADATNTRLCFRFIERVGPGIDDLYHATFESNSADKCTSTRKNPDLALDPLVVRSQPKSGRPAVLTVLVAVDRRLIRTAKPDRCRHHSLEHRIEVEGRATDDLQYIAGRGLVFQ